MRRFTAAWPGIDVEIGELDDEEVEQAIERGELDVGFVALPVSDAPLETSELVHDPYVLVVAAGSPFATSPEPPTLAEIGAERLIGFKAHRSIELDRRQSFARPASSRATRSARTTTAPCKASSPPGSANAIQPRLTVDEADPRIVVRDLEDIPPRVIAIARHRDRYYSPAARAFVEAAVAVTRP